MIIPVNLGVDSYDIVLERGAIKKAGELLGIPKGRKVLLVTDSGVPEIYVKTIAACFEKSHIFVFPQGEQSKNFDTYKQICETLSNAEFTRKDAVIAVGGGVSGDMAGFAAATYMRGIDFYNIPTTLLSQVDSSIGGKTAIDLGKIKNIIGAFHQPKKVIIDPDVLSTLDSRQLKNGFAEAIKAGVIMDEALSIYSNKVKQKKKLKKLLSAHLWLKRKWLKKTKKKRDFVKCLTSVTLSVTQ